MSRCRQEPLTTIHRLEEIPAFGSEAEEHAFWANHELSEALWDQAEPLTSEELPVRATTTRVVIDLDAPTVQRLKALARRRHKGYRALLGELVRDQLQQVEREQEQAQ